MVKHSQKKRGVLTLSKRESINIANEDTSDLQYLQRRLIDLTPAALDAWQEALENPITDTKTKVAVAEKILDRRFGRPKESREISGNLVLGLADLVAELEAEDDSPGSDG
jgi:hypothetical protein